MANFVQPSFWLGNLIFAVVVGVASGSPTSSCPFGLLHVASFEDASGTIWTVCEDIQQFDGAIVLKSAMEVVWLSKTYEPIHEPDENYYLGFDKAVVLKSEEDLLGRSILNCAGRKLCEPTWDAVEKAVPPIRKSGGGDRRCTGVRTFVGSRGSTVDATFSDIGNDCQGFGFPIPHDVFEGFYRGKGIINATAARAGETPQVVNYSGIAEGLLGGALPVVIYYFPIEGDGAWKRYWTMVISPVPDMKGNREQSVWFRYQQVNCTFKSVGACVLHSQPLFFDTYWWPATGWIPTGQQAAAGFYSNLLAVHRYWSATLEAEQVMSLNLPSKAMTNGTWMHLQGLHSIIRSMITRADTWFPRYGVLPGYGDASGNGFQDTFTSTAIMALEWGAFPYARGVIDNWLRFYMRPDGSTMYRGPEIPQTARTLTVFALYYTYTGDALLLLEHFSKISSAAQFLIHRWKISLTFSKSDPRYGIPSGDDEADNFINVAYGTKPFHFYSAATEMFRGFTEIGRVWQRIGSEFGRADISEHAASLLSLAPLLLHDLRVSMNQTAIPPAGNRSRCWPYTADAEARTCDSFHIPHQLSTPPRSYSEMMWSGVLSLQQVDDIYETLSKTKGHLRLGIISGEFHNRITPFVAYGFGYGLLQHDMIERFLLHFFANSAHGYTRGTWTAPESSNLDRELATVSYSAASEPIVPIYLKWALVFEEPEMRSLWFGKALPRVWLESGEEVAISAVPTNYGRVSIHWLSTLNATGEVRMNVTLPSSFMFPNGPPGGVRLRVRSPAPYVGGMTAVTVGGKPWKSFDSAEETIDFAAHELTSSTLQGLSSIVALFSLNVVNI